MAFSWTNLTRLAGGNGFTLWHYKSTDAKATIDTAGYFNTAAGVMNKGDMILLNGNTGGTPDYGVMVVVDHSGTVVDCADLVVFNAADTD